MTFSRFYVLLFLLYLVMILKENKHVELAGNMKDKSAPLFLPHPLIFN